MPGKGGDNMQRSVAATLAQSLVRDIDVDNMTGLGNIFAFLKIARQEVLALNTGANHKLAVVLFDIDNTSGIQEVVGEQATDYVIATVASTLYRAMPSDLVSRGAMQLFRLAGDEFALIMRFADCFSAKALVKVMQRAVAKLQWETYPHPVTVSASMACYPSCSDSFGELLFYANHFMHQCKQRRCDDLVCAEGAKELGPEVLLTALHQDATALVDQLAAQIVDKAEQLQRTTHLALTDPLTGLPNLRAARQMLQRQVEYADKHRTRFGLLMVDGDRLKEYNQLYGYAAGNEMIRWLGRMLQQYSGDTGFVARWFSGDEFLMLLPELSLAQCRARASEICKQVAHESRNLAIPVTVSVGVASYPETATVPDELIAAVEQANRRAKEAGRNQVCD
jgi:diguanylate cyclase (GGDEF)-like protein